MAKSRGRPSLGKEGRSPALNVRLAPKDFDRLDQLAREQRTSSQDMIRKFLQSFLGHPK